MFIKFLKIIPVILTITLAFSEALIGEYRLIGLNIVDYDFSRQNTDILVTEKSGFDSSPRVIYTVQRGENIDYDSREPYPLLALNVAGVELRVYFSEDGTATILAGSTYPTETAGEGCFTEEVTLPIQEDFTYDVNFDSNEYIPLIDIIGFESVSPYKGLLAGTVSISESSVFDNVPINPTEVSVPFPIDTSSVFNNNNGGFSEEETLPGMTGGYVIKSTEMYSFIDYLEFDPQGNIYNDQNPPLRPSLYLEWHAIDGEVNESGLGDLLGVDEDGYDGDFDSTYGLDKIKVTTLYSTDECGANSYSIAGNHVEDLRTVKYNQCINEGDDESICSTTSDEWIDNCVDFENVDNEGNYLYVMDLSQDSNFNWGGYITWNSMQYEATGDPAYLADDSNDNFLESCMTDGDFSDCSGRIIFEYTPQCIPSFNMRYFMAELQEQCQESDKDECGVCFGNGIPQGYCDCYFGYRDCNGNCDEDPSNDDLSCFGCDGVYNSGLEEDCLGICGGNAIVDCDGVCGGNNLINDGECDCDGNVLDCENICGGNNVDSDGDGVCDGSSNEIDSCPNGNQNWVSNSLTDYDGDGCQDDGEDSDDDNDGKSDCWYSSEGVYVPGNFDSITYYDASGQILTEQDLSAKIAAGECQDHSLSIDDQILPDKIYLSEAYPNPFNPIVNFNVEINYLSNIELNIYSINGQLVETLYKGDMNPGIHPFSWQGNSNSSGIYIINLNYNNSSVNRKVILLK